MHSTHAHIVQEASHSHTGEGRCVGSSCTCLFHCTICLRRGTLELLYFDLLVHGTLKKGGEEGQRMVMQ